MNEKIKPQDEGKLLVTSCGDVVGVLERIDAGDVYVRPKTDLLCAYGSWIAGPMENVQLFVLDEGCVSEITSDRVVIEQEVSEPSRVKRAN